MEVKVSKFVLVPCLLIYDDYGNLIDEKRLKPLQVFTANNPNLIEIANKLEKIANEEYFPQTAQNRRPGEDKESGKEL